MTEEEQKQINIALEGLSEYMQDELTDHCRGKVNLNARDFFVLDRLLLNGRIKKECYEYLAKEQNAGL